MAGRQERWPAGTSVVGLLAVAALLVLGASQSSFVDPDVWHELALIREARQQGTLPTHDWLAYTPTVEPSIHHEWGTGVLLYAATSVGGGSGLLLLKLGLTVGIAVASVAAARRAGVSAASLCALAPVAIFLSWYGFSTVRAQMFTLLFTALLMLALARDREGKRAWVFIWLCAHVLWLNLHAGFVVGLLLLAAHALEQALRRRPIGHLLAALFASGGLVLLNPFGWAYVEFLWKALLLPRPAIEEWLPVWRAPGAVIGVFGLSLVLAVYAAARTGIRRLPGLGLVVAASLAALWHQRHVSIYAVVWVSLVPAWIDATPLGDALRALWIQHPRAVRLTAGLAALVCLGATLSQRPWKATLPSQPGDHPSLTYPVGAVAWLDEIGFRGNVEVPFLVGAYVGWKLNPEVLISVDSRYEVAYPPEAVQRNFDLYAARTGWQDALTAVPTDAVLVPVGGALAEALPGLSGWARVYRDDAYELYLRPGRALAPADRRGENPSATIP
jgi:hypothetical protein